MPGPTEATSSTLDVAHEESVIIVPAADAARAVASSPAFKWQFNLGKLHEHLG